VTSGSEQIGLSGFGRAWKTLALAVILLTFGVQGAIAQDPPAPPQAGALTESAPAPTLPMQAEAPAVAETLPTPEAPAADAAEPSAGDEAQVELPFGLGGPEDWTSPEGLSSALTMLLLLTVVSLAPAVLLMTTCFVRIVVVLGLVRQALGAAQLPPTQVMTSIALFMTLLVMTPVWSEVYNEAIVPYTSHEITLDEAWNAGIRPVRAFMSAQIERTGNSNDVWLFYKYQPQPVAAPASYDDVPLTVLLPAFMLSELKTAFLIGFQIYLPFLVLDLVVASVTISMGMVMLPPMLVSLPLKLLLFVLVDGWHLVVGMLLESFQT
jgi:flagellar biosynthesis protein FliP